MINRRRVMGNIGNIIPIFGVPPITTNKHKLLSLKAFGGTEQSGTPTPDTPIDIVCNNGVLKVSSNGQIYADGIQETIEVHGKNLLNPATRTDGYYISANGNIAQDLNFCCSALIPVKPNTNYMLSGITGAVEGNRRLHAYDSNGNWISQIRGAYTIVGNIYNITGTTPNNCAYVRISIGMADTNVQLEQGSTATAYEPYFSGGTAIAEMLLKVGQYQDEQSVLDGVVTRNVGVKVLDGTENWGEISGKDAPYVISIPDMIGPTSADDDTVWTMNTHFIVIARNQSWSQYSNLCSTNTGRSNVQFRYKDNQSTLANFKQFLADQYNVGTPVIIVYPLATPTTEQVTGQTLTLTRGTNIIDITQASLDNLELEVKAK